MEIQINILSASDIREFTGLLLIFEKEFEKDNFILPETDHLYQLLNNKSFIVIVAKQDGMVAGGLTAYLLPSYDSGEAIVYLYDLAVSHSFQKMGIGKKLLQFLSEFCRMRGYNEFFVQAEEIDEHALEFYRATGGKETKVSHFNYSIVQ